MENIISFLCQAFKIIVLGIIIYLPIMCSMKMFSDMQKKKVSAFRVARNIFFLLVGLISASFLIVYFESVEPGVAKGLEVIVLTGYIVVTEKFYHFMGNNLNKSGIEKEDNNK